jgi:hypothetical protein
VLLPTWTLPKLTGLALRVPADETAADRGTARVELEAFEVMVRLPLRAPIVLGAQVILIFVLLFGASVIGVTVPVMVKPAPVTTALLTVTGEPPELVMVAIFCWLLPVATVPKATGLGLARDPGVGGGVTLPEPSPPTPLTEIDTVCGVEELELPRHREDGEVLAVLDITMVSVDGPAA